MADSDKYTIDTSTITKYVCKRCKHRYSKAENAVKCYDSHGNLVSPCNVLEENFAVFSNVPSRIKLRYKYTVMVEPPTETTPAKYAEEEKYVWYSMLRMEDISS